MTNVSWPGIDCPPPPIKPGGPINCDNTAIGHAVQGRRLEGEVLKRSIAELHGWSLDSVTAACLLRMKYSCESTEPGQSPFCALLKVQWTYLPPTFCAIYLPGSSALVRLLCTTSISLYRYPSMSSPVEECPSLSEYFACSWDALILPINLLSSVPHPPNPSRTAQN